MKKFEVLQINLSREQIDIVNNTNDYPEFYTKYLNTTFRPTAEAIQIAADMYKKVAVIFAENFEDVFTVGNVGPEKQIVRLAPMHSVSVGDVVIRDDGVTVYVDTMGFKKLPVGSF
jgi:predicted nuclease of restriction endonuclease-like RecB superfamily